MQNKAAFEPDNKALQKTVTYQIKNKTFVVEPVFRHDGKETLATILLRLMKFDVKKEELKCCTTRQRRSKAVYLLCKYCFLTAGKEDL